MERLERIEHPQEALLEALQGWQKQIWTTLPGIVQSFDPAEMTVSVQPSIQMLMTNDETSEKSWVSLPILVDVPVVLQSSGGMTITMPIKAGDECLVSFANRCIDAWWQSGGIQQQAEFRMHDLSDGFAFIGPRSLPRVIANYSTDTMQIRSDDGSAVIDIHPTTHVITMTMPTLNINGNVNITGDILTTGVLKNNGKFVGSTHQHADPQGGTIDGVL